MSQQRFLIILLSLRFDDISVRRSQDNPIYAINEIFQIFIDNCQKVFNPGSYVCIDEMLVAFRGRCKFIIYMPNKPDKYGIKIMCLTDSKSGYLYNAYIYCGKDSDGVGLSSEQKKLLKPSQSVIRLAKPIYNSNRCIIADNWFSSIELAQSLKKYVGTLKKNKREIPLQFLPNKNRDEKSSIYGFTKEETLISYVPKKNKAVLLLSTMHHSAETDSTNGLPEIISFYNCHKGGVDTLDEMCSKMTCGRRTRRWPCALFFRMLDIAAANAYILHNNKSKIRSNFIKDIAKQLVLPHIRERVTNIHINLELRMCMERILGTTSNATFPDQNAQNLDRNKRKLCYMCPSKKYRKTVHLCTVCKRPICLQCSNNICKSCQNNI